MAILVVALLGFPVSSHADSEPSWCAFIDHALVAAAAGETASLEEIAVDGLGQPNSCSSSLGLSGIQSAHCIWAFTYRAEAATVAFEEALARITECAPSAVSPEQDQAVNHPDFYDLRVLPIDGGEVGLSLKDKAERQSTFLFFRASAY